MYQLLRNHTHGSDILLSMFDSNELNFIKKSSYTAVGIDDLKRELSGYSWYFQKLNRSLDIKVSEINGTYFEIKIPFFDTDEPIKKKLSKQNLSFFLQAIDHYNQIWPFSESQNGLVPVHGDYSLDGNILLKQADIVVMDWEHFSLSAAPRGFDVLYLIFESIKICCGSKLPSSSLLNLGKKLISYASDLGALDMIFEGNTFDVFLSEQSKVISVWGDQKDKLPTARFSQIQLSEMQLFFGPAS